MSSNENSNGNEHEEDEQEEQDHEHSRRSTRETAETLIRAFGDSVNSTTVDEEEDDESSATDTKNEAQLRNDYAQQKRIERRSSLDLRRLPVNILLKPTDEHDYVDEDSSIDDDEDLMVDTRSKEEKEHTNTSLAHSVRVCCSAKRILQSTCLNSKYSLKMQMMLSFGIIALLTIGSVVLVGLITIHITGRRVQDITRSEFHALAASIAGTTAHYLADDLTPRLLPVDVLAILEDATNERFAGYRSSSNMENIDSWVPFRNIYTNQNQYPLRGSPIPLDWQFQDQILVNESNYREHVQQLRYDWYQHTNSRSPLRLSTTSAAFSMQGMCDPTAQVGSPTYLPDCADANNNITHGGILFDSVVTTNELIHRKASDLSPLLKALYEYHQDFKSIGLYFSNSGVGATMVFPHMEWNSSHSYTSQGCNWLLSTHPLDRSRSIVTLDDFERCDKAFYDDQFIHQSGNTVPMRFYNPMDTDWCMEQAIDPSKAAHVHGPYLSSTSNDWQLSIGRAIYDPITNDFLACTRLEFMLSHVENSLHQTLEQGSGQLSHVTIVMYGSSNVGQKSGTVVASTNWNHSQSQKTVTVDELLEVGVTQADFQRLIQLVDYSQPWDPEDVKQTYEEFLLGGSDGKGDDTTHLVAAYPMPTIPSEYSEDYVPEFLVLVSVEEGNFLESANVLSDSVDDKVTDLTILILVLGCIGLALMTFILFMVAHTLTAPLKYMNKVAEEIMQNFGDYRAATITNTNEPPGEEPDPSNVGCDDNDAKPGKNEQSNNIDCDHSKVLVESRCAPKTELSEIVKEFLRMVTEFSGKANAKSELQKNTEIANRFPLAKEFKDLYESRNNNDGTAGGKFRYIYDECFQNNTPRSEQALAPSGAAITTDHQSGSTSSKNNGIHHQQPRRLHFGRNIHADNESTKGNSNSLRSSDFMNTQNEDCMASPLLFWVVVLIVTPLLITTISISSILMVNIAQQFPDYVEVVKEEFVKEEKFALRTYVDLRASLTASTTERAVRDLHLLTRYASWMVFGGLNFSDGFTEVTTGVEECKTYSDNITECPYVEQLGCDPDDRYTQQVFYAVESHDTDILGNRYETTYPNVSFSSETTAWRDNITTIPGAEKGPRAGGYETTYDRLRSASAIPVTQMLHRYEFFDQKTVLGSFVAFEDDGLFLGFVNCRKPGHVSYSTWYSSVDNGAEGVRPELCPLGKFGYDPRCRDWYGQGSRATGGEKASFLYASPPYLFAATNAYAQTATSPLIDPNTGKHVGQTLIDFNSQAILDSLDETNFALASKGFPLLITIESDNFGADTVIGPGRMEEAKPVADLVLANDPECIAQECQEEFYEIVKDMKLGKTGSSEFTRIGSDGSSSEKIHISYAPVIVKSFTPVDSSDVSRGVVQSEYKLYSLAFAEIESAMLEPFISVEGDIDRQLYVMLIVLCITIVLAALFVFYFSSVITVSMTEPMLYLLQVISHINRMGAGHDPPEHNVDIGYGSREVLNVTITMERLHKVIRSANAAFFSGDVETAYEVLNDALKLFKRLENKKAIGVACNNLGNTMLAAYRTLKATKEKRICGFKKKDIIAKGFACFHEAIQQGEKAYDDFYEAEGWSPNCLDFMQHLSNRYFNRAIFLLTVKNDHDKPDEIEELGKRDLQISRDMDVEINDEGTQVGWNIRGVNKKFEVMLSRFRGHLLLLDMGYSDDFELDEWLEEASDILKAELRKCDTSALFEDMTPAGRMQQIESELMKYYLLTGQVDTAAKIAIRMLVEDEYTLPGAQVHAVQVLESYLESKPNSVPKMKGNLAKYRKRLEKDIEEHDSHRLTSEEDDVFDAFSTSKRSVSLGASELFKTSECTSAELTHQRRISLLESTRGEITMETF